MYRRNARTQLVLLVSVCGALVSSGLLITLVGGGSLWAAQQAEAPAADAAVPTPSPSDAPPPVAEPAPAEAAMPSACGPVAEQAEPAPCCAPCGQPRVHRCRTRVRRCRPRCFRPRLRRCSHRHVVRRQCSTAKPASAATQAEADPWKVLFDGKSLAGWKITQFGGEGEVEVRDGMIVLETGADMTGITYAGDPPRNNYELQLEGQRLAGSDFFCTTTFPVGEEYCSLVVGGWGGTVVGLSNVDYYDAGDNFTTKFMEFKDNTWYPIRIRVSDHQITVWIDGEKMIEQPRKGHKFDLRMEVDLSRPLGVSTWQTAGAVRSIRVRPLTAEEIAADAPEEE